MKNENKLIAEFMGLPLVPCNIGTENGVVTEGYQHPKVDVPCTADGLQYKYSWDWLMPVVDRVEQVNQGVPQQMLHLSLYSTIDEVYQAVVEFIKNLN